MSAAIARVDLPFALSEREGRSSAQIGHRLEVLAGPPWGAVTKRRRPATPFALRSSAMTSTPEWLSPFSFEFQKAIAAQLADGRQGKLACLDADGTLWSEDIGEALLRWLAAGGLLPKLGAARDPADIWDEYEARVKKNRSEGYGWAVQVMAGLEETDVRRWSRQMAHAWPNYRPAMAGLVQGLTSAGYEVWLVSASNGWIVAAGAAHVNANPSHVLGVRVEVDDGELTDRLVLPVTCNQGKVEAIEKRLGRRPDLAIGDSLGDLEMLEFARLPLAVGRHDKATAELLGIAKTRGWATHLF